jgi:2-acetylphloroglucinol acetyltransferase
MTGIVGYGVWIPYLRVSVDEIYRAWRNQDLRHLKEGLHLRERAVLQPNEDTITLSVGAAERALEHASIDLSRIGAAFLGTCTDPYDSRPSVTVISEALGLPYGVFSADVQFAGKSGTTAVQIGMGLVASRMTEHALCIGTDTINRHSCPGRIAEYSASAAAVAVVLGNQQPIAEITHTSSYASDLSDAFRIAGERYIQDIGDGDKLYPAFEAGMVEHVTKAAKTLFERTGLEPKDYDFAVFQQPNGAIPFVLGERLGFSVDQIKPGVVATDIGDCGAASALLGLAAVLDQAARGCRILVVSYGFGAGADAFSIETTAEIERRRSSHTVVEALRRKSMIDYATACRLEYKYAQDSSPLYL